MNAVDSVKAWPVCDPKMIPAMNAATNPFPLSAIASAYDSSARTRTENSSEEGATNTIAAEIDRRSRRSAITV